jgi:hypothetical protein
MSLFGFDIGKMLGGGGEEGGSGGGGMIMNMIMKQLASPGTQKMIAGKVDEMFAHLAGSVNCKKEDLALLLKLESLPAKDESGTFLLEEKDGVSSQKFENKAIIYVMVEGKAVQKIAIDQFLAMMQEQGG